MSAIRFGTDGWRGVIAEEFTFANVRRVAAAVAGLYAAATAVGRGPLAVGYDRRFLSERVAAEVAKILAAAGHEVLLADAACPTPAVALAVRQHGAVGGIMITASHNAPEYNGLKLLSDDGGPALPETTRQVEEALRSGTDRPGPSHPGGNIRPFDPLSAYTRQIISLLRPGTDRRLDVIVDPMHGVGGGPLGRVLRRCGHRVSVIRGRRDPLFGGDLPDPSADRLARLRSEVVRRGAACGLATDGDADRFGIVAGDGSYLSPNLVLSLLYRYLVERRGWQGGVARTVATTAYVDRIAAAHGVPVYQTPVGFKYVGRYLLDGRAVIGGEESGGLSVRGHLPIKDGVLACALVAEMVSVAGPLEGLLDDLRRSYGLLVSRRLDLPLEDGEHKRLRQSWSGRDWRELAGRRVIGTNQEDGLRVDLEDGGWCLIRPSGTEPLVRLYVEGLSEAGVREIQKAALDALGLESPAAGKIV